MTLATLVVSIAQLIVGIIALVIAIRNRKQLVTGGEAL